MAGFFVFGRALTRMPGALCCIRSPCWAGRRVPGGCVVANLIMATDAWVRGWRSRLSGQPVSVLRFRPKSPSLRRKPRPVRWSGLFYKSAEISTNWSWATIASVEQPSPPRIRSAASVTGEPPPPRRICEFSATRIRRPLRRTSRHGAKLRSIAFLGRRTLRGIQPDTKVPAARAKGDIGTHRRPPTHWGSLGRGPWGKTDQQAIPLPGVAPVRSYPRPCRRPATAYKYSSLFLAASLASAVNLAPWVTTKSRNCAAKTFSSSA